MEYSSNTLDSSLTPGQWIEQWVAEFEQELEQEIEIEIEQSQEQQATHLYFAFENHLKSEDENANLAIEVIQALPSEVQMQIANQAAGRASEAHIAEKDINRLKITAL